MESKCGTQIARLTAAPSPALKGVGDLYEPIGTMPVVGDRISFSHHNQHTGVVQSVGLSGFITKSERTGHTYNFMIDGANFRILKRAQAPAPQAHKGKPEPSGDGVRAWKGDGATHIGVGGAAYMFGSLQSPDAWCKTGTTGPDNVIYGSALVELPYPEAQKLWDECKKALGLEAPAWMKEALQ